MSWYIRIRLMYVVVTVRGRSKYDFFCSHHLSPLSLVGKASEGSTN